MRSRNSTLAISVLTTLLASSTFAANTESLEAQLIQQGQYWQTRDKVVRSAEIWQKVLQLNPSQVDALYGMGFANVKQNQLTQAQEYLRKLRALSPIPWQANQLAQDIELSKPEGKALLAEARRLVDAGDRDKATEVFRRMFKGITPSGTIGREYYNNLAFNTQSWPDARKGMERLIKENPNDEILTLFYAKQLTRYESSRAEGIRLLARLAKRPDIGGDADESWRLALTWMGPPNSSQVPLFNEFLKAHPNDQEIRELINKGRQKTMSSSGGGWQQNPLIAEGLRALDQGNLVAAEKAFTERLATRPDDPDALGGMGIVRQQQNLFPEALQLLDRAVSKGGTQWRSARENVRYWALLQQGRDAQADGQTTQAKELIAQAMRIDSKLPDGRLALADIQSQAGKFADAATNYRLILASHPGHPQAVRGLIEALSQTGQTEEAIRLLDGLSPEEQKKFGDAGRLRAMRASQVATAAEQRGDMWAAQNALREAIQNDPDNAWSHFNLARLYLKANEPKTATNLINGFVAKHPNDVEALYVSALLSVELEQWREAWVTLQRVPPARRTTGINTLTAQVSLKMQIDNALTLSKTGQGSAAFAALEALQPAVAGDQASITTLASAYAEAGYPDRAKSMMQNLIRRNNNPSADLLLQYASVLLKTGDDAQVYSILSGVQGKALNESTRKRFDDLLYFYRIRQADTLRQAGNLAAAYDTLLPALMQRPEDPTAISALARMYSANKDHAQALELYKPILRRNPKNTSIMLGAANEALIVGDKSFADDTLRRFVELQPKDPVALTEAARIYRAMGDTKQATRLLQDAIALEKSQKQPNALAGNNRWDTAPNPFLGQADTGYQMLAAVSTVPLPAQARRNDNSTMATNSIPMPASSYDSVTSPSDISANARTYPTVTGLPSLSAKKQLADNRYIATPMESPSASPAQQALSDIQQERSAYITQGLSIRSNNSESGLSKLVDVETPLEVNIPAGSGRLALRITPVLLTAGAMTDDASTRFGGGYSSASGVGSQRDAGIGLSIAYALPASGIKFDIGTTPIGFEQRNVVGGVSLDRPLESNSDVRYGVILSRRAVTDSLTSFAGTTDARDGSSWGGVTANGGRVQMSYDDQDVGVYGYGSLHALIGTNVKSNSRGELGAGVYKYLRNSADNKLTLGLSTTLLGYANNQNFFTYGHGGYFSPQSYVALSVPVAWSQRSNDFTYQVKGAIGLQTMHQDAVDYFPNNATLQAASGSTYAEQNSTGIGYSMEATGEYRFGRKLFVGGTLSLDNARSYRQYNAGVYLRYTFEDMLNKELALPVSPFRSPYSN